VSSITLAHYIFQLIENRPLNGEPDRLANWVEEAELRFPDFPGGVSQSVPGADQLAMNRDTAQIELVIDDETCEADHAVLGT
jgi:hypothetical protein